jgi:hypothetical protein
LRVHKPYPSVFYTGVLKSKPLRFEYCKNKDHLIRFPGKDVNGLLVIKSQISQAWWLMPIILAIQATEIRRMSF